MKEIKTVGIVGFGVMGAAIGLNAAASGYKVIYKELNDELVKAMYDKWVINSLNKARGRGKNDPGGHGPGNRQHHRHHPL